MQEGLTPNGEIVTGYKATDENMKCRGFQYELGKWYEHEGGIAQCESGFHFCEYPSGPWFYYNEGRLFKCEAELVLKFNGPGADIKHVAKRIRLVEEIKVTGDRNTGYGNTGDWNTGDRNTGYRNTGDRNTGYLNTGDGNTGNRNTGNRNTGDGNTGDHHSGCLNHGDAPFYIFNKLACREDVDFDIVKDLSRALMGDKEIDPTPYLGLPHASAEAIKNLHEAHKEARRKLKG